jgi:hypothetical protein
LKGAYLARLPNAEKAVIDSGKLKDYILSPVHPVGRFKAAFFQKFGYSIANWEVLEQHLRDLILAEDVIKTEESPYGKKFIVQGQLKCSTGEKVKVVTVWVILKVESIPRFVTVYPGE